MQVKQDDGEFYAGMFYGTRECGGVPHNLQPDNNIFFTAITAFAFKNMLPHLNDQTKAVAKNIVLKASSTYPNFRNRFGYPFYNFWPTYAPIMPHTYYFKYLKVVFGQGEDADDTVMILMTSDNNDSVNAIAKKRMVGVSNLSRRRIISTFRRYRDLPAYSTWMGLKMTPDFDFSVQCNIMYFMLEKGLRWVSQDTATIDYITEMVKNRYYKKRPVYISPYYVKTPVLLYHLCRLMGAFKIPQLEVYKPQLIADIRKELEQSTNIMDQIILRTSLLRLQTDAPALDLNSIEEFEKSNQQKYLFFQARPAFSYPTPFKQIFLHWSYINYYFYCPAYNKTLWLEYLVEKNKTRTP
ncbi:hypothetical protein SAE01_06130 [Segetibacter aerophilus]|uniref:Uncharacterized protein n=2 Tax=Segetibacter aerophilus TaxID=670293 RepID=A0A512B8G1_9BACT|nr:hypothetical protein SAE01_06130 [Segetibacter aerophilus]